MFEVLCLMFRVYGVGSMVLLLEFMVYGLGTLHPKPDTHPVQHMLCCIGVRIHVRMCAFNIAVVVEAVCTAVAMFVFRS